MKRKLTKEELQKMIDEYKTYQKIADIVGVSSGTIGNWAKSYGIKSPYVLEKERRTKLDKKKILLEYQSGKTTSELGLKYGVHRGTINEWVRKEGGTIRDASQARRIYDLNEHYFDIIDTKEKSYILGFLAADGYTYQNSITGVTLSKKDEDAIDFIIQEMEITAPKNYKSRELESGKIGEYVEIRVHSLVLTKRLQELGITPNKTLTLSIEDIAKEADILNDKNLLNSFLLGYFDGDGGIYHYAPENETEQFSMSITGTKETCDFFLTRFKSGFLTKRHKNDTNNYTFQIGGRNKVKEFLEPLYSNPPKFFFTRKYNIFTKL